jgi:hypothetical protein
VLFCAYDTILSVATWHLAGSLHYIEWQLEHHQTAARPFVEAARPVVKPLTVLVHKIFFLYLPISNLVGTQLGLLENELILPNDAWNTKPSVHRPIRDN